MKKIGVLLPQSKAYPTIGKDFVRGLKQALGGEIEMKIEGVGLANNPKDVIDSIQKLINQEDVALTTGLLGHKGMPEVLDFVEGMDETLIYADLGAAEPESLKGRKGVYCNSFGLFDASHALGKYLVENGMKNIGVSTCYYDAGYAFLEALENAVHKDPKGQLAGHFITPLNPRENEAELMAEFVSESKPDAIFGFHNGVFAKEHAEYLRLNKINESTPLYTLPFSIEERVLKEYPYIFNKTRCVSSWFPELENEENTIFIEKYKSEYGSIPSIFALLGYENGLLIEQFLKDEDLITKPFSGPRGSLNINPETNRTSCTHYLWELLAKENAYIRNALQSLELDDYSISKVEHEDVNSGIGGWHNAYLCH